MCGWRARGSVRPLATRLVGFDVPVARAATGSLLGDVAAESVHTGGLVGFDVEVARGHRRAWLGDRADLPGGLVVRDDDRRRACGRTRGGQGGEEAEAPARGG